MMLRFSSRLIRFRMQMFGMLLAVISGHCVLADDGQPVEPILQKYCLGCHNQQDAEAGLSLQTYDQIKRGGDDGAVLNSGDLKRSRLFQVLKKDSKSTMPPHDEPQPTVAERKLLKKWVLGGAKIQSMAAGIPKVPSVPLTRSAGTIPFSSVAISKTKLAVGENRAVTIRDVESWEVLDRFVVDQGNVTSLTYAPQRHQLLAAVSLPGIRGMAVLIDVTTGEQLHEFSGHTDAVYSAVFSPDRSMVATAGYDRRILVHNVATGKLVQSFSGHHGSVFDLDFDGSGQVLCSASTDGTVKVWNVATGERIDTLSQAHGELYCVKVSPSQKRIYAAGQDHRIRTWDLVSSKTAATNPLKQSVFAHEHTIHLMQLSPDEQRLATADESGIVRIWDTGSLNQLDSFDLKNNTVTSLAYISNKRLAVTALNGSHHVFRLSKNDHSNGKVKTSTEVGTSDSNLTSHAPSLPSAALTEATESDDENDTARTAQHLPFPVAVSGVIHRPNELTDVDCFAFDADAGTKLVIEVNAARSESDLDSRIEILSADGTPLLRTNLQAVRDSWFTFRGKNGDQTGDFRLFNWEEMELNEYLYADGEVTRLYQYPRGPDSGFNVYPGFGTRHTYFGTTGTSHALLAPAFIVEAHDPAENIVPNGLPVFPVYFENDDDGFREFGADSRLFFEPPATGRYVVRISDARDFTGENYHYTLTIRETKPDFSMTHNRKKITVAKGTGTEIEFKVKRVDGFSGPITVEAAGIPDGFICSTPVTIQKDQYRGYVTLFATENATTPTEDQLQGILFTASAQPDARGDSKQVEIDGISELKLVDSAKLKLSVHPPKRNGKRDPELSVLANDATPSDRAFQPVVLKIHPGETIAAFLKLDRVDHGGIVSFGKEDAGRNLPHGVFVDNIGLNGLLLLENQNEREFFLTASVVAEPGTYSFFLKSNVDGATCYPLTLVVEERETEGTGMKMSTEVSSDE